MDDGGGVYPPGGGNSMLKKYGPWVLRVWLVLVLVSPIAQAKHWILLGTAHVDKSEDQKPFMWATEQASFAKFNYV